MCTHRCKPICCCARKLVAMPCPHSAGNNLARTLVVPRGQMKTNLLGMSFLDRLESWEVRADRLMLHGYP